MPTAYDCLHRAVIKKFGKWYRFEWDCAAPETREKIRNHALAEEYWQTIFLRNLSDLQTVTYPDESVLVSGSLTAPPHSENDRAKNIAKLLGVELSARFWVFSSYDFDERFSLCGFQTKAEAIRFAKSKQNDIFFSFWFRF